MNLPALTHTDKLDIVIARQKEVISDENLPDEVDMVAGKLRGAGSFLNLAPVMMLETIIRLKPEKRWMKEKRNDVNQTHIPGVSAPS